MLFNSADLMPTISYTRGLRYGRETSNSAATNASVWNVTQFACKNQINAIVGNTNARKLDLIEPHDALSSAFANEA